MPARHDPGLGLGHDVAVNGVASAARALKTNGLLLNSPWLSQPFTLWLPLNLWLPPNLWLPSNLWLSPHPTPRTTQEKGNIMPGTVIDRMICNPFEFDFYLNS